MVTVHVLIKGKVQRVFYRVSAKEVADDLGVKGWIRNTKEGDVESMASGDEKMVAAFIDWCRKGPEDAVVREVIVTPKREEFFVRFSVVR